MSAAATPKKRVGRGLCVRPIAGETESGTACAESGAARGQIVVVAGWLLGHGNARRECSARVRRMRPRAGVLALQEVFARAHRALLKTRGAVAAVARFDEERRRGRDRGDRRNVS